VAPESSISSSGTSPSRVGPHLTARTGPSPRPHRVSLTTDGGHTPSHAFQTTLELPRPDRDRIPRPGRRRRGPRQGQATAGPRDLNGRYTYRNTVAVYGDEYLLGVSAEHREAAKVKAGDVLEVDLELDTAPREVAVPADFAAALDAEPAARRTFDALSYSNRSWHVGSIEGAKTDETRQRRIEKSIAALEPASRADRRLRSDRPAVRAKARSEAHAARRNIVSQMNGRAWLIGRAVERRPRRIHGQVSGLNAATAAINQA
jgi:hypothetical protein